jgi:hypothetical protein
VAVHRSLIVAQLLHPDEWNRSGPELFETVEAALLNAEQVYHDIAVVDQHPARRRLAFHPERANAIVVAERLFEVADHRLHLPIAGGACHDEVVGNRGDRPNVEQDDIGSQFVGRDLNDPSGELLRFQ